MLYDIVVYKRLTSVGFKHHPVVRSICRHVYISKHFYLGRFYQDVYEPELLDFDEPSIHVSNPVYSLGVKLHNKRSTMTRITADMQVNSQTPIVLGITADVSDLNTYKG
jgi:hypothetical protein